MGLTEAILAVSVAVAASSLGYSIAANADAEEAAEKAKQEAQARADAEIAERNRLTAEHAQAVQAEAERERSLAISYQDAQNVRVNALAAEAAANEKAIAQNILERSQEEALIVKQESARETARIQDLQAQTEGRQLAALASGGAAIGDESGTAGALLLDTKTRANKDITAVQQAATSKENLLQKTGAFAVEQGEVSSKNILESAEHQTLTASENVKNAGDTLVANAKIGGATEVAMANLQNLMTLGSARQFGEQVDRLKSESNAKMWSSILGSNLWSKQNLETIGGGLSSLFSSGSSGSLTNSTTGSGDLSILG